MADDSRLARTDLRGYFAGIAQRLRSQVDDLTTVIVHSGEMGDNDHLWFADFLRQNLPQRIGVDTGFVVNCESDRSSAEFFASGTAPRTQDESIGPQSDILLLDVLDNAPFCTEKTFRVCPVEMVLGVIEVTRLLDAKKLETDLRKISRVRALATEKRYSGICDDDLPCRLPIGFVVGLKSSLSGDEIMSQVKAIPDELRPDGILLLDRALWIREPYDTTFLRVENDVLFHFVAVLRQQVEHFPRGRTDLQAYIPIEGMIVWGDPGEMGSSSACPEDLPKYLRGSGYD